MIYLLQKMETALLPPPEGLYEVLSLRKKVQHYVLNILTFFIGLGCLPLVALFSSVRSLSTRKVQPLLQKKSENTPLPAHRGFADSLFQTSGLGTNHSATPMEGVCQWNQSLNPQRIEGTDKNTDYGTFFIDVLGNPDPFIQQLQKRGVTAYRFSLEWSVMEPRRGEFDAKAAGLYRTFIKKLKEAGIEPYVTLHHFVHPQWFQEAGGFDNTDNVTHFISHARSAIHAFPEVKYWMTFNEPGVFAFQGYVRGVYPPHVTGDLAAAGRVMRNMLMAHCEIYGTIKAIKGDAVQIGITHQWLKFEPLEGNLLEKVICYFLSKITHYAVYNFFKTGQFALQVPFKANVQFSVNPKEKTCDFFGVQFYGFPRLKAGWNGGQEYPGYKITNLRFWKMGLTFGSTCPPEGTVQSFGPSIYPESLEPCLEEAFALGKPVAITETGCDARVQKWGSKEFVQDDQVQKAYYEKIFAILQRQKPLQAFFAWTMVRSHLEWDRGSGPCLGTVNVLKAGSGGGVQFAPAPAGELLAEKFTARPSVGDQKQSA